ncbi:peptide chain release factor 2 [Candidatus Omnitrophota bacterium]
MIEDIKKKVEDVKGKLDHLRGYLDLPQKEQSIAAIQDQMNQQNFWDDSVSANKLMGELRFLKSCCEPFHQSCKRLEDVVELVSICEDDAELIAQIEDEVTAVVRDVDALELKSILSGPYDRNNVIFSINAGAGGTESCDWAGMLLRMYTRWAESKKHKVKIIDILHGDEAGIKSVTLSIEGEMAYGNLKSEKGVHRLVRISPFDSNKRRHTSFVSVDVIPEVEDSDDFELSMDEVRIDIFRSSGPGGQCVNTTDSAVRMTHVPTGIVVQCQNERSQLQNKAVAMKVLKSRLSELRRKEQEAELSKEYGSKQKIEWGSQIRSYVMQPYLMVKDHRTSVETGNVASVMDGNIDMFIEGFLKMKPDNK